MIAPSWPKVVRPVADGKDLATCSMSIGPFLASSIDETVDLVANAAA